MVTRITKARPILLQILIPSFFVRIIAIGILIMASTAVITSITLVVLLKLNSFN